MTDMTELAKRKLPLNLAIVHVDPDGFLATYRRWLEITTFISALRIGEAEMPDDGITPQLTEADLANGAVHRIGNDTVMAFCATAAMKGDGASVDKIEAGLKNDMGDEFPGSFALRHFRNPVAAPITLEDFVGASAKKLLEGDIPPPPKRASECWETGLRFLELARGSNFKNEIMYPLALWTRDVWTWASTDGLAFLAHIEDSQPILTEALKEERNDEPFIANMLQLGAPAVEIELDEDVEGMLRSLARR
ncbi:hypothetical protein AUC68_11755 [Methyloceanibacter methanicus]|uniref:Uncharacterized protein n=1 Tax=Methyloceanibacter methanicus TaxID=1774968 RepID=A0A1E3W5K9_9HYPH|nr:hypothetical protein [Methyloceanibacter methanicus]ODS01056.1 hypothetical protein AUC68_11755 [Methyloceanibacter methanicus]